MSFEMAALIKVTFVGNPSVGNISVVGPKVGDYVLFVVESGGSNITSDFGAIVTEDDTIPQAGAGIDGLNLTAVLARFG
jgi:hypothetical protein